jgi:hypothetical protein
MPDVIESSLKDLSNIVEREGRYFIQCLDGEIETTLAEIEQRQKTAQELRRFSEAWQRLYGHKKWKGNKIPVDAEYYLNIQLTIDSIREIIQEKYNAGDDLKGYYKICDIVILDTEQQLSNPYADVKKLNAWLAGWQSVRKFLDLFPKREAKVRDSPLSSDATQPISSKVEPKPAKRPLRQVALLHLYEKRPAIKRDQRANELAQQYGHRSGQKLYEYYRKLSKPTGITGLEGNELPSIIADIQAVLPLLSGIPKQIALAHLQTLKAKQQQI